VKYKNIALTLFSHLGERKLSHYEVLS